MRFKVLVLCAALSLGGCATTGTGGTTSVSSTAAQVQAAAVMVCGFLPTVASVSSILAALIPGGGAVEQLVASAADQICAAVLPAKSGKLGAKVPTVHGIVVHGRFVR